MKTCACIFAMSLLGLAGASAAADPHQGHAPEWRVDFRDDFESFDPANWQDQIFQTAATQEYNLSFSEGNEKGHYPQLYWEYENLSC